MYVYIYIYNIIIYIYNVLLAFVKDAHRYVTQLPFKIFVECIAPGTRFHTSLAFRIPAVVGRTEFNVSIRQAVVAVTHPRLNTPERIRRAFRAGKTGPMTPL